MPSPPWYRTARTLGGTPWVPFQIAQALQEQLDEHHRRLVWAEQALAESQRHLRGASGRVQAIQDDAGWRRAEVQPLVARVQELEGALADARAQLEGALQEAAQARAEADRAREQAAEQARGLAEAGRAARAAEDEDPRLQELRADLQNVRRHVEGEIARGVREERVRRLQGLLEVHDDLLRSLHYQSDIQSPWYQGHAAILKRTEAVAARAAPGRAAGEVAAVEQVGFALEDGTLVRPARVVVAEG